MPAHGADSSTQPRSALDKRAAACPRQLSIYSLTAAGNAGRARELFGALVERGPVHWDPYVAAWLVCGPAEVTIALSDERFSSSRTAYAQGAVATDGQVDMNGLARRMLVLKDGAEHVRLKKIVQAVLSPRRIRALEPWMRELAAELLPGGAGRIDFASTVARRFPLLVLAKLLDIPERDLDMVQAGSDAMTEIIAGLNPTMDGEVHRRARVLYDYALALVRDRRARPGDDGVSALVAAADADGGLEDADIAANLVMLIASGHQTMPGFLSLSLQDSLERDAPCREVPDALAHVTPSRFVGRVVTAEVELGGCLLRPGDAVVVVLAAANWAPDAPPGSRHFAFGYGRHRCAGSVMAELEAAVMFDRFAEVCPVSASDTSGPRSALNDNVNLPALTSLPVELPTTPRKVH